jgi:hypothetical protein
MDFVSILNVKSSAPTVNEEKQAQRTKKQQPSWKNC